MNLIANIEPKYIVIQAQVNRYTPYKHYFILRMAYYIERFPE